MSKYLLDLMVLQIYCHLAKTKEIHAGYKLYTLKYYSLIVLIFFISCSAGKKNTVKNNSVDALEKYSYKLAGFLLPSQEDSIVSVISGTGFFIKKENQLFLITAKHVITGCENDAKPLVHPSNITIWSPINGIIGNLDISLIKDTSICLPFQDDPDVIAIKVNNEWRNSVNVVDEFIMPVFKVVGNTEIFGYPASAMFQSSYPRFVPPSNIHLSKKSYQYVQMVDSASGKVVDSINYWIFSKDVIFDKSGQGYSGSPVFVEDIKTKKWRVAGVAVGWGLVQSGETFLYVTRIDYVLEKIKELGY